MLLTIIYYVAGATQCNNRGQRNVRWCSVCDCCRRNQLQSRCFSLVGEMTSRQSVQHTFVNICGIAMLELETRKFWCNYSQHLTICLKDFTVTFRLQLYTRNSPVTVAMHLRMFLDALPPSLTQSFLTLYLPQSLHTQWGRIVTVMTD